MKYFENVITGEIMKTTMENFNSGSFNKNQWTEITEERYNQLKALED